MERMSVATWIYGSAEEFLELANQPGVDLKEYDPYNEEWVDIALVEGNVLQIGRLYKGTNECTRCGHDYKDHLVACFVDGCDCEGVKRPLNGNEYETVLVLEANADYDLHMAKVADRMAKLLRRGNIDR